MAETSDPVRQDDVPERADRKPERLLAIVRSLVLDLHPRKQTGLSLDLESRLDRDLGIDSLGRSELLLRIEGAFQVRLPETLLAEAETVGDLLIALETASERLPSSEALAPVRGQDVAVPLGLAVRICLDDQGGAPAALAVLGESDEEEAAA